jgi:hypothetical protein
MSSHCVDGGDGVLQDRELIERARKWFGGLLPPEEDMEKFTVHVVGPRLGPGLVVEFHSFACFYPVRGIYIASGFKGGERPERRVDALKIRETIAGFDPSEQHVLHQRRLAADRLPGSSASERWIVAVATSHAYDLPVALIAFGHSQDGKLVAYTMSGVMAPLRRVASEMKRAAPQISMN